MEENTTPDSNVNSTINAVAGLVKEIPIYQDTVQPAAKEVGKSLHTIAKTLNIALAPIKALVWGYEKIEEFIVKRVSEKLENVDEENIITPDPKIAVPAIEALRYSGHDENLRELYANLLANSMDKNTIRNSHPGFVEIIKNISSDEALLLKAFINGDYIPLIDVKKKASEGGHIILIKNFSIFQSGLNLQNKDLVPSYLDNLIRLGLLEIPSGSYLTEANIYDSLENDFEIQILKRTYQNNSESKIEFTRKYIRKTTFGNQFVNSVVKDK